MARHRPSQQLLLSTLVQLWLMTALCWPWDVEAGAECEAFGIALFCLSMAEKRRTLHRYGREADKLMP